MKRDVKSQAPKLSSRTTLAARCQWPKKGSKQKFSCAYLRREARFGKSLSPLKKDCNNASDLSGWVAGTMCPAPCTVTNSKEAA